MLNSTLRRKNIFLMVAVLMLSTFGVLRLDSSYAIHGNDVIDGGISNEQQLQSIMRDDRSNPHARHIYNTALGTMDPNDMKGMVEGAVHRDGRVTVNGKTVATDAHTSGRKNFRNSEVLARDANGKPVAYHAPAHVRFSVDVDTNRALVKLDENGKYQHAVLKDCGNPVIAKPVEKPEPEPVEAVFECKDLVANPRNGRAPLRVTFTAKAEAQNTKITGYEFSFGDGETVTTNTNQATHTYTEPGNYAAEVNVITEDGETGFTTRCTIAIEAAEEPEPEPEPSFECVDLKATKTSGTKELTTRFTAEANVENTEVTSYEFNFGDGTRKETASNTVTHTYEEPGNYTARVNVKTEDGQVGFRIKCEVKIEVKEPAPQEPEPEPEPAFECKVLQADKTRGEETLETTFTAKSEAENTEIVEYNFDFGDGNTKHIFSSKEEITTTHTYEKPGEYNASVTVRTEAGTTEKEEECQVDIKVKEAPEEVPEEEEEKPEPEGKVEQPEELANTGIGGPLAALFGSGALGMGIRGWFMSRRKLINSLLN